MKQLEEEPGEVALTLNELLTPVLPPPFVVMVTASAIVPNLTLILPTPSEIAKLVGSMGIGVDDNVFVP